MNDEAIDLSADYNYLISFNFIHLYIKLACIWLRKPSVNLQQQLTFHVGLGKGC